MGRVGFYAPTGISGRAAPLRADAGVRSAEIRTGVRCTSIFTSEASFDTVPVVSIRIPNFFSRVQIGPSESGPGDRDRGHR